VEIAVAVTFHKQNRQNHLANPEAFVPYLNHALYLHALDQNSGEALCVPRVLFAPTHPMPTHAPPP
jgi:hypothetical protein